MSRRALLIGGAVGLAGIATAGGIVLATRTPSRPVRWTTSADRGATAVAASGNDVYMVDAFGLVHAFDPAGGAVRWNFQLPGGGSGTPPALQSAAGTCYVESRNSGLCALDAASGQPRWTNKSAHLLLATDELLVCTARERVPVGVRHTEIGPIPIEDLFTNVQGLDPMSGATRWSFRLNVDELVQNGGALAAGQVHLRSNSRIFTLNAAAGTLRWEQPRPAEDFDWAASRAGLFYATSTQVVRLDAATGASLWSRVLPAPTFDSHSLPSITCNEQSLFLASAYGQEAWDARSGEQQWHVDQPGFDPPRTIRADWRINTWDGQISTSDMVILLEMGQLDDRFVTACRVSARSTRDGDTLWTAPIDGVGSGGIDLALGTDNLFVLPLNASDASVVRAISLT